MATVQIANMDTRNELKQEITIYIALSPHHTTPVINPSGQRIC